MSPNSRCQQNLSNTVYRIEMCFVEKQIKFDNWLDRGNFLLHFRIPGVTKHEKICFQKKKRFFDKLIIKHVQNELLSNNNTFPTIHTHTIIIKIKKTLGGYPLRQTFRRGKALFNNSLKTEIGLLVKMLLKFNNYSFLGPDGDALNGSPWG